MNIKQKILIPSLVAVAMMLVLGIVSYLAIHQMKKALELVSTQGMQHIETLSDTSSKLLEANLGAYRLFANMANLDDSRIKKETEAVLGHVDAAIALLKKMGERGDIDEIERQALASFDEPLAKYRKTVASAIDMAGSDLALGTGMMQAADKRFIEIDAKLHKLLDDQKQEASAMIANAMTQASKAVAVDVGIFLFGLLAAMGIAMALAGKIVAPMIDAIRVAKSIAGGTLTNTIDRGGKDETGELLQSLAAMQDSLRDLIGRIGESARTTLASSGSMTTSLQRIDSAIGGQNDATAAVAAAVEQMSVSVNNIHDNASQALAANQKSAQLAAEGANIIQTAFDEMTRISATVKDAAGVIEQVGQQSNEISSIVRVIREVADQTNLLALNAAIEAARAGEAGRGFAVVADEVRKLAEKTTSSAEEITRMIGAIQQSSGNAVNNIHHVVSQMETTAGVTTDARASIERIRESSGQSEGFARDISAALREQSQASHLIAQQVETITRMSDENAQSVSSAGQAMRQLEAEARSLNSAVARFNI